MYSVVLMMALSGGAESVDFGHRCNGCACSHGCNAVVASCNGCNGCHGCHGGLFSRLFSGHGCHGCNGGCNGCHAVSTCNGGCHGCHGGLFHRHRCCGEVVCACSGAVVAPEGGPEKVGPGEKKAMPKKGTEEVSTPATVVVNLPADATLTVDGNATRSASERRVFVSPPLATGSSYVYTLRADITRDGQVSTQTQNVTVRGGQTTNVSFNFASQGVASR